MDTTLVTFMLYVKIIPIFLLWQIFPLERLLSTTKIASSPRLRYRTQPRMRGHIRTRARGSKVCWWSPLTHKNSKILQLVHRAGPFPLPITVSLANFIPRQSLRLPRLTVRRSPPFARIWGILLSMFGQWHWHIRCSPQSLTRPQEVCGVALFARPPWAVRPQSMRSALSRCIKVIVDFGCSVRRSFFFPSPNNK